MPYIITTKRRKSPDPLVHAQVESRRAVATLEEAQKIAYSAVLNAEPSARPLPENEWLDGERLAAAGLPESGGTISLPDGTVIEVEPRTWFELTIESGFDVVLHSPTHAEIIDAYNAQANA